MVVIFKGRIVKQKEKIRVGIDGGHSSPVCSLHTHV